MGMQAIPRASSFGQVFKSRLSNTPAIDQSGGRGNYRNCYKGKEQSEKA